MSQADIAENFVTRRLHLSQSIVIKACTFATRLAGIVAEYVMATLASYLLGNLQTEAKCFMMRRK